MASAHAVAIQIIWEGVVTTVDATPEPGDSEAVVVGHSIFRMLKAVYSPHDTDLILAAIFDAMTAEIDRIKAARRAGLN
ncbi:MAG TPA: hypothetical protein VM510_00320 [Caulifigura sp.]|nr:hypothetical protein [Caulifigura sp.]